MASTISYKGEQIATADNQTRTLLTQGKYLEGNLIVTDVTPPWSWLGKNPVLISEGHQTIDKKISETSYNGWTPSTTAKAILATVNGPTFSADMAHYEYVLEWLWDYEIEYASGTTLAAAIDRQFGAMYQVVHRRAYGLNNFDPIVEARNYCTALYSASSYVIYYNTSGTRTWTTGQSYGFYAAQNAATLSSTSENTVTVTPKSPTFNARCSNTYLSTSMANAVDQASSTLKAKLNIYRVDIDTNIMKQMFHEALEMYAAPLSV